MRIKQALLLGSLTIVLGACSLSTRMDAPVNPQWDTRRQVLSQLNNWEFTGRVGVRDDQDSQSSRIRWRQHGNTFVINLWGTLNIGATEINGSENGITLKQEGEPTLFAESPEQLIYEQLGYELPVTQLNYWIKGVPAPASPSQLSFNEENALIGLQQLGWQIEYLAYTNFGAESLPTRIRIQKPPLRLDFVRLNWTLPNDTL
ncbi:MAG: lipoprotein insertase outer membrane protein LolB [Pseudohongiellaceae bacterium]|nr:lipoprotein insertase outer membrane protein LolB [Pseudohongiellaceae bacterium]